MKPTYKTFFIVRFDDGTEEAHRVRTIKKAMELLNEIDIVKSKCDATVVVLKLREKIK